ncbi:hypothetical protein L1987_09884 [Smallanthus sonchifolius]|uniref:Uncharacterized protein n=1 Tax=Smallanthus sonchifolius TaxID=185202 RepID=A0ACB9JQN3_9ASTR|nr:hypothetical protein L1987_09884 [Smallanthus sonchifolius]
MTSTWRPWRYFHRRLEVLVCRPIRLYGQHTAFPPAFEYNSPSFVEGAISISLALDLFWVPARALGKRGDPPTDLAGK